MNDIVSFPFQGWSPAAYEQALKDEFDQLYEEGTSRRRMMVVSLDDRCPGTPRASASWIVSSLMLGRSRTCGSRVRMRSRNGRSHTVRSRQWYNARAPDVSGLPGSAA
jgi:hypothetical protein